jgi:hypothetical protein
MRPFALQRTDPELAVTPTETPFGKNPGEGEKEGFGA